MEIGSSPHDPFEPQAPLQDAPLQDAPLQDAFEYMPEVAHFETRPAPPPQKKAFGGFKAGLRDMFSTHVSKSPLRIRLVAVVFAALFLLFIGRLAYLGLKPDPHSDRREASDAVSAARPNLVDRNGEVLAQDIKVMSVFAEPRRIIDKDEATELVTAILPDVNARELREKLGSRKGFVWVKREVTPEQQQASLPPRPARRRLHARKQARLSRTARSPRMCSASPISTTSALPASKNMSTARASPICMAPASA